MLDWSAVATRMRPFVRKRVRSDADADDVLQELFLRVERGLPSLQDTDRLDAWLYRIVRNLIADHHRAGGRAIPTDALDAEPAAPGADPARELSTCVAPFVAQLPSPFREAVTMVDLEGMTHKAAAARAGISEPGMKSRVQRGRARLRGLIEACCHVERDRRARITGYERRDDACDC